MTVVVLSFATRKTPGRVMLRCDDLGLAETRGLEPNPPFASWTRAYQTGHWTSEAMLGIGLAIGNWLDGPQHWLSRLSQATAPLILVIETTRNPDSIEQAALEAPWELIAHVNSERGSHALAPSPIDEPLPAPLGELLKQLGSIDRQHVCHLAFEPSFLLSVVRRLGSSGPPLEPSKYRLSVVFMPCQPEGSVSISPDVQERAIREASQSTEMHLEVEDSGSLDGLCDLIARLGEYDVLQVSCPAALAPSPRLAFEDARGKRVDVSADDIWNQIGQMPRLLVVSAHGEAAPGAASADRWAQNAPAVAVWSGVLGPLSTQLCQRGWPAVIGLACATAARLEIDFAAALYRLLSQRISLLDAFARASRLVEHAAAGTLWHRARLVLGPGGGGPLVDGADVHPERPLFIQNKRFLDANGQIPIDTDYRTSLHRGALQRVVSMLREAAFPGIVVHGSDELSRATFVSRVLRRMERTLRRVVVTGDFDAATILRTIREQTAHPEVAILAKKYCDKLPDDRSRLQDALRAIVEGPCRDSSGGAFVLVLHNFDPMSGSGHVSALPAILGAFAGANTASRLLITCNVSFSVIDEDGIDISQRLAWQPLDISGTRTVTRPRPIEPTTGDHIAPRASQMPRILVVAVGIALSGLGVALMVSRTRVETDRPGMVRFRGANIDPPGKVQFGAVAGDRPGMVRFRAADIHMVASPDEARPEDCIKLVVEGDCKQLLPPDTIKHVAAFDLDNKEVTNGDFYVWLNAHRNNWLPTGEDGIVRQQVGDAQIPIWTEQCLDKSPSPPRADVQTTASWSQLPVTCVTWYGATRYCRDQEKRLPFESEWQLAAKGVAGRPFPWGTDPPRPDLVAYELDRPRAVGTSRQDVSPENIYDLAANAAEWVQSDDATPELQIVRGGSFSSRGTCPLLGSKCVRAPWRKIFRNVGFRCARSVDEQ